MHQIYTDRSTEYIGKKKLEKNTNFTFLFLYHDAYLQFRFFTLSCGDVMWAARMWISFTLNFIKFSAWTNRAHHPRRINRIYVSSCEACIFFLRKQFILNLIKNSYHNNIQKRNLFFNIFPKNMKVHKQIFKYEKINSSTIFFFYMLLMSNYRYMHTTYIVIYESFSVNLDKYLKKKTTKIRPSKIY